LTTEAAPMPRPRKVPSYCFHKASGRAVARVNGRDHYLGVYGSEESYQRYESLIAEWRSRSRHLSTSVEEATALSDPFLSINDVLLQYKRFAATYYADRNGTTKEYTEMGLALRPVRELYGDLVAREFGPLKLQAVRQKMIEDGLARGVINNRINRVKRAFKWAVSQELIPPSVYEGLRSITGLKKGRTDARETAPVKPVEEEHIEAILPHISPQVAAMIQIQRLTGMRPGEVVTMRGSEICTTQEVWVFAPEQHKNAWRGHDRLIPLGPQTQKVIQPFLKDDPEAFLFSPCEAEEWRNAARRQARQTPMTPSQRRRCPKASPKRRKRDCYDTDSYRRAVKYGIKKTNRRREQEGLPLIPSWSPLQIRHLRATELNLNFGIEAAAVSLGHAHAEVTKVYAERNLKLALEVAKKMG
jgi:integrase